MVIYRQPSGKDHWNQCSPYNLTLLQLEQTTGSSGQRGTLLSPLACLVGDTSFPAISPTWLHRYYFKLTELADNITEFNNKMPLTEKYVFTLVIHYFSILILCSCFDTICIVKSAIQIKVTWLDLIILSLLPEVESNELHLLALL